jgi:hypothetical protein
MNQPLVLGRVHDKIDLGFQRGGVQRVPDDAGVSAGRIFLISRAHDLYSFRPDLRLIRKLGPVRRGNPAASSLSLLGAHPTTWLDFSTAGSSRGVSGSVFDVNDALDQPTGTGLLLAAGTSGSCDYRWSRCGKVFAAELKTEMKWLYLTGPVRAAPTEPGAMDKLFPDLPMSIPGNTFVGVVDLPSRELTASVEPSSSGIPQSFAWIIQILRGFSDRFGASSAAEGDATRIPFVVFEGDFFFLVPSGRLAGGTDILCYRPSRSSLHGAFMTDIDIQIACAGASARGLHDDA